MPTTKHASPVEADTRWLTIGEAAKVAQVHPDTLRRAEKAGQVEAHRLPSGHRRFALSEIERAFPQARRAS